jgi:hypothetical protein
MREDPRVDVVVIIVYFASVVFNVVSAFGGGDDDAIWELHWRSLDVAGQAGVATAAGSRDAYEELGPEEKAVVAGYRRHQRRRSARVDLMPAPFLIVAGALVLTGVLEAGLFGMGVALAIVITGIWNYLQKKQMNGKLRLVAEAEAATASAP